MVVRVVAGVRVIGRTLSCVGVIRRCIGAAGTSSWGHAWNLSATRSGCTQDSEESIAIRATHWQLVDGGFSIRRASNCALLIHVALVRVAVGAREAALKGCACGSGVAFQGDFWPSW